MFSVTTDKRDGQRQLIAGSATAPGNSAVLYACVLERDKVVSAQIIDRTQFSLLIAVVVLSAIVPTAIAQRFYSPAIEEQRDLTAPVAPAGIGALSEEAR